MRYILLFCFSITIFSCGQDKVLQLPEISHSEISKINDVSAAYLFYDETETDSVELNRKNLINSTNWLINVDKRLTIKQVIPHIKFLQEKKRNSSHKKENSKNYFTCNNASKKNLGFIEFTNVVYHDEPIRDFNKKTINNDLDQEVYVNIISADSIPIEYNTGKCGTIKYSNKENLLDGIKSNLLDSGIVIIYIGYNQNLTFQEYIQLKSKLSKFDLGNAKISNHEFIFN